MSETTSVLWKVEFKQFYDNIFVERKIRIFSTMKKAQDFVYDQIHKIVNKDNYKESYNCEKGLKITYNIKSNNIIYNCEYYIIAYFEGETI